MASLVLLAVAGAAWQGITTRRIERQHPPPGRLVDVEGRRLQIHRRGEGSPTVVIEPGLAGASSHNEPQMIVTAVRETAESLRPTRESNAR